MPRQRKASAELAASGAFREHRKRERFDLEPIGQLTLDPPSDLNLTEHEQTVWRRVVALIPVALRAESDLLLVHGCVQLWAKQIAEGGLKAAERTVLVTHLRELGLTEQGRRKLALTTKPEKPERSPAERLAKKLLGGAESAKPDGVKAN